MSSKKGASHRHLTYGCVLVLGLIMVSTLSIALVSVRGSGQGITYPATRPLSSQTDYQGLPDYLILNDTFLSSDSLYEIRAWYIQRFRLSAVSEGIGSDGCHVLYGSRSDFKVRRYMGVMICEAPGGQIIQITRSILLPTP